MALLVFRLIIFYNSILFTGSHEQGYSEYATAKHIVCGREFCGQSSQVAITCPVVTVSVKKVKFSHTRYRALGPELIPVYRQSARR